MRALLFISSIIINSFLLTSVNANPDGIQRSHLNDNLPSTFEKFKSIFNRDVTNHFSKEFKTNINIKYELLRDRPTQSGVSYPKFYAWVEIKDSGKVIGSGAIRVVAIDKVRVEVTNYISQKIIMRDPKSIEAVFPRALCKEIRHRAGIQ